MKQRVISAVIAFMIFIPIFIIGGNVFNIAFYILIVYYLNVSKNVEVIYE